MDGMGFLIAVVAFVLALIALNKISRLATAIAQLRLELGATVEELRSLRASEPAETASQAPVSAEWESVPDTTATTETAASDTAAAEAPVQDNWLRTEAAAPPESAPLPKPPVRDMEQALASRWFVWIGGVAIAFGGLLFVKYAYDNSLIPPALQIVLGLVLGAALVAAGEFVRRRPAAGMELGYVPAALAAGGIVTAFGSVFAAYALYELISPALAFGGLAVVALGALALSRLQGPLIAALGLLGSYVTPALIPSEHPSAWGFFPYLLVILVASFATLRGRNWCGWGMRRSPAPVSGPSCGSPSGPLTRPTPVPSGCSSMPWGSSPSMAFPDWRF